MEILGIDFGCTAIKFGKVHLEDAISVTDFSKVQLGREIDLESLAGKVEAILDQFSELTCAGIGFPTIVRRDALMDTTIPFNALWQRIRDRQHQSGRMILAVNDADAAGTAEVLRPEADALRTGVTVVLTLGTGIGSAVFHDGILLPNTELGVIEIHSIPAEQYTAASVRTREKLSFSTWAGRLQEYLNALEFILSPDTIMLGGGISAEFEHFAPQLHTQAKLLPAFYRNQAGVIGAAMAAMQMGLGKS